MILERFQPISQKTLHDNGEPSRATGAGPVSLGMAGDNRGVAAGLLAIGTGVSYQIPI
jgi:hypothetical protein